MDAPSPGPASVGPFPEHAHVDLTGDPGVAGPGGRAGPERVVLTGTVVGPDGKPAAGAEVVLADDASSLIPYVRNRASRSRGLRPCWRPGEPTPTAGSGSSCPNGARSASDARRRPVFLWAFGPRGALAMRPIPDDWPPDGDPRPAGARAAGAGPVPRARPGRTAGRRGPAGPGVDPRHEPARRAGRSARGPRPTPRAGRRSPSARPTRSRSFASRRGRSACSSFACPDPTRTASARSG